MDAQDFQIIHELRLQVQLKDQMIAMHNNENAKLRNLIDLLLIAAYPADLTESLKKQVKGTLLK